MKCTYIFWFILLFNLNQAFAQKELSDFFNDVDVFLQKHINNGKIDYPAIQQDSTLSKFIEYIRYADLSNSDTLMQQAFLINAYNLHMLSEVVKKMPFETYFDKDGDKINPQIEVARIYYTFKTLNEQLLLLKTNPAYHFALVNNGFSFHILSNKAFRPTTLNNQLVNQIKRIVNHSEFMDKPDKLILPYFLKQYHKDFIKRESKKIHFSQYLIKYLNQFRINPLDYDDIIKFKRPLDFEKTLLKALQDTLQNKGHKSYLSMAMLASDENELRVLNSIKRQHVFDSENEVYTSIESQTNHLIQYRFGVSSKLNFGMQVNYQLSNAFHSPYHVYGLEKPASFTDAYKNNELYPDIPLDPLTSRPLVTLIRERGFKAIGPKIWFAPLKKSPNLIIESAIIFPAMMGFNELHDRYFFNQGITIETYLNYYNYIKEKLLLDLKVGMWIDDIGKHNDQNNGYKNTISMPANVSLYYLPNKTIGLYSSMSVSFNSGKIEHFLNSNREKKLHKHRGFSSFNRFGLILRCSPMVEINASYFKTFYGYSYASTYRDYSNGVWSEELFDTDWINILPRSGAGFDLNFIFSF